MSEETIYEYDIEFGKSLLWSEGANQTPTSTLLDKFNESRWDTRFWLPNV